MLELNGKPMKYTLSHIQPVKAAWIMAILSLLVTGPMSIASYLGSLGSTPPTPQAFSSAVFTITAPLLYAAFTFFFTAVLAWLYNVTATRFGGIQITLETTPN